MRTVMRAASRENFVVRFLLLERVEILLFQKKSNDNDNDDAIQYTIYNILVIRMIRTNDHRLHFI